NAASAQDSSSGLWTGKPALPLSSRVPLGLAPPQKRSTTRHGSFCDADIFWFSEKTECFLPAFTADAALFHAAEGHTEVAHQPAVHPHRARVNLFRDAMGAAQVLRPDARGEAVFGVVCIADHFLFFVKRCDRNHGSEDFLA